jgi:peptidoglycan L-alanyl-D-glutamate endopeptidase CwlK
MPQFPFSQRSLENLESCHEDLQYLFKSVANVCDCTILIGHRGQEAQDEAFRTKLSEVKWPNSYHNQMPSLGVDVAPYPIDWADTKRFYHFAGIVRGVANNMGTEIWWGGDWDGDMDLNDQTFMDLAHYELHR